MKATKAVELLTLSTKGLNLISYNDLQQSLKLAIEALKWIKENRVDMAGHVVNQLPGETPEDE